MTKHKSGKSQKAPYESTYVRTPTAIKSHLEGIIDQYRQMILDGEIDPNTDCPTEIFGELPENESVLEAAKGIIRQKKSARKSLSMLLTFLYNTSIEL